MDKFWKWMHENGWAYSKMIAERKYLVGEEGELVIATKEMLIGYMLKFMQTIAYYEFMVIPETDIYESLKEKIEILLEAKNENKNR